ncbi:MAG: anthranilate phosphoribosyltransferase [Candidatus Omnitrophota bacterium]
MDKITQLTNTLGRGEIPDRHRVKDVFGDIMSGRVTTEDLKAFLLMLKDKETPEIISGAAQAMREKMIKVDVRDCPDEVVLDTCGTGGNSLSTFNISTAAAFVVSACGIKVAKHGNRAVSSRFGSADVLGELGLNLGHPPDKVCEIIRRIGIGFLFAPLYHPAMKYAACARKELAIRTIFNILGPLCNPAGADTQVLGVYDRRLLSLVSQALADLGCRRAFVVYSPQGLDEVSVEGPTMIADLHRGKIRNYSLEPKDFGIDSLPLSAIAPGDGAQENARMILDALNGKDKARADAVVINAALGIVAAGKADDFRQAVSLARQAISCGGALNKLNALIDG